MPSKSEFYDIADELRALANAELYCDKDAYARERSKKVLALSARLVAGLEERDSSDILL